jgi:hypothetical protein
MKRQHRRVPAPKIKMIRFVNDRLALIAAMTVEVGHIGVGNFPRREILKKRIGYHTRMLTKIAKYPRCERLL